MPKRPQPRLKEIPAGEMTARQRELRDAIFTGPRGKSSLTGPFAIWLHAPEFGDLAQKLGAYCRYHTALPPRLSEFAILVTASLWRAQYEWFAHAPLAVKAGLSPEIVADLKKNRRPANMPPEEAVVYDFITELTTRHAVSDETFANAKQLLGEQQVVDLTAVAGTYITIAMMLAMAEQSIPVGDELPFKANEP